MKIIARIASLILIVALLTVLVIWSGVDPLVYVDLPSLILVTLFSALPLLLAFSPAEIGRSVALLFSRGPASHADLETARAVFRSLLRNQLLAGGFGSLFGFIAALTDIRNTTTVGVGLAVALLTLLYGFAAALFVSSPAEAAMASRLAGKSD